ncbi:MAG TPA: uroporphyrinogen-III C-methyltransferase [Candidatus Dormibacteraeota bacterium]
MSRSYYPVYLDLNGRRCVVLGEGELASEKVLGLRRAGADVVWHRRPHQPGDFSGATLAIDASGDLESNARARDEATREKVQLNVVDVTDKCDWIAPAIVRRGPLQIAISTAGESPFLASTLRARIERWLGEEWGPFTQLVGRVRRRLRGRGVPLQEQTAIYRRLMRPEVRELLRLGETAAAEGLAAAIESGGSAALGRVALVGAGPGSVGLLTVAARDLLADADIVLHDALIEPEVLALCGPHAQLIDVGKRGGRPSASQGEINRRLIEEARSGRFVVRLKGGDPFLFGRGGEEIEALATAGIEVTVVPGVSAALAAPAAAGIPLTHREMASTVAIVAGHGRTEDGSQLEAMASAAETLVVLMPGKALEDITARVARVVGADRPAALISSATTPRERVVRAPIGRLAEAARAAGLQPPATLVVGHVVALGQVGENLATEQAQLP